MSFSPFMSSLDADFTSSAGVVPGDSFAHTAGRAADQAAAWKLDVSAPADLMAPPLGGLEKIENDEPSRDVSMEVPLDLTHEPIRDLRRWSNALYKVLDTGYPPLSAVDDYQRIVSELERREAKNTQTLQSVVRETFRDNALGHRFELFRNGLLAGYVSYTMRAWV
jgi:hypothetical protein